MCGLVVDAKRTLTQYLGTLLQMPTNAVFFMVDFFLRGVPLYILWVIDWILFTGSMFHTCIPVFVMDAMSDER